MEEARYYYDERQTIEFESIDLGCLIDYKTVEGNDLKGSVLV
jgi:hypothetical protein